MNHNRTTNDKRRSLAIDSETAKQALTTKETVYCITVMEGSTTLNTTEVEKLQGLFCEIRDQLAQQDGEALKKSALTILTVSKPQQTMDLLAPLLFRETSDASKLASQEALSVLGFLVHIDSAAYLKPASRAFKKEAVRLTTSEHPMHVSPECLQIIVSQLSGNDVEVSANATQVMVACCRKLGLDFCDPALRAIVDSWQKHFYQSSTDRSRASTVCVRCASSVAEMACLEDATMRSALQCGAFDLLLAMSADDSDPLLQMSALDLIEKLALVRPMHHERAKWLFNDTVTQPLLVLAGGAPDTVPDAILGGPALRVVAALCKLGHGDSSLFGLGQADLIRGFHGALHNFQVSGELDRLALVDAISSFASASPDALDLVINDPVTRQAWLSLKVAQPKLKSAILTSVAMVLDPSKELDANGDSISTLTAPPNAATMKLYTSVGRTNDKETTDLILSIARSPLPEARLGAYTILIAVAKLSAGGQVLFTHPGFYEWLMSREGETTKEGREAKYTLVEVIVGSQVKGLLADEIVKKLEQYIKQGPHYLKPMAWEVATAER